MELRRNPPEVIPPAAPAVFASSEIRGIQFLRAIAALMVVAHHSRHYFPDGQHWSDLGSRGVDIFFVISGFIMAHTTRRYDPALGRVEQASAFLRRRFLRVVPLYWVALLWTAKRQVASDGVGSNLVKDFFFVPHFHPIYHDGVFPVLVPGWTINYEMFFYALFAASLLLGRRRYLALSGLLVALVVAGALPLVSAPALFYTRTVLLEFVLGIGVYASLRRWPRPLSTPAAVLASALGLAGLAWPNSDDMRGLLDGPFAALLVWSAVQWMSGLRLRWLHFLGDASYSIYLFHLASFAISGWLLVPLAIVAPTPGAVVTVIALQVAVAIVAGGLIHVLVERPWLRAIHREKTARASPKPWTSHGRPPV